MDYEQILFDIDERVALITLNRPEAMNTWTNVMANELNDAMHRCNDDDEVRAVVLTGAGNRAFCAGADLGRGGSTFGGREQRVAERAAETRERLYPYQISKPVIAAINGAVFYSIVALTHPFVGGAAVTPTAFEVVFERTFTAR